MDLPWYLILILVIITIASWECLKMTGYVLYLELRIWYVNLRLEILEKDRNKKSQKYE